MNDALADLLAACDVPSAGHGIDWRRIMLVNNIGGVPSDQAGGDVVANRGFNVVVLGDDDRPRYFCKCRPADAGWGGRTSLAEKLSRQTELADVVPPTWSVHTDLLDAEVSRYLHGEVLESRIRAMTAPVLEATLASILDAAAVLSQSAARIAPELLDGDETAELGEIEPWILGEIVEAGLEPELAAMLGEAIRRGGAVTRALQHGDLWLRNALLAEGHWRILDFELYGAIQVPLYDAFHLVRTAWDGRVSHAGDVGTWFDALTSATPGGAVYRRVLQREIARAGLSPKQTGGTLAYYVVDFAARMWRRRIPLPDLTPYVREAKRLAEWIASGRQPEDVFSR